MDFGWVSVLLTGLGSLLKWIKLEILEILKQAISIRWKIGVNLISQIFGARIPAIYPTIDFVFAGETDIWGSDDDTDIEYMYQYLHSVNNASILSEEQIRDGWLKHIKKKKKIIYGYLIRWRLI